MSTRRREPRAWTAELRERARLALMNAHVELVLAATIAALQGGWMSEVHSPLGRAAHVAAVLDRIGRARSGRRRSDDAMIARGRHLLTIEAVVDEWLARADQMHDAERTPSNDNAKGKGKGGAG